MAAIDLTIKPAQTEIVLNQNTSAYTQAYDITNNSSEAIRLFPSVETWIPSDSQGSVVYDSSLTNNDFSFSLVNSDLRLGQDFILAAHQKKQLVLRVSANSPDSTDGYYTFFVNQKPINDSISSQQNLGRLGSHLLISSNVKGTPLSLEIKTLTLSPRLKDIFQKISITGEIYNPDIHYQAINGRIIISKNNQELFEQHLFPHTVLANNYRTLTCLDSAEEPSPCSLPVPLWPGHYQGKIIFADSPAPSLTFSFFVFPYSIVIIIILFFTILFLSLKRKHC